MDKQQLLPTCTHDGVFHADEVLSIALLKAVGLLNLKVIRTRDPRTIADAAIVTDVGGIYNLETLRFDHHQFEKDDENYGLSSAGLVWKYLKETKGLEDYYTVDKLVKEVDDHDTGAKKQEQFHFCGIISSYNATNPTDEEQETQFQKAVDFAIDLINNLMASAEVNKHRKEIAANTEIAVHNGIRMAILPKGSEWAPKTNFIGKADLLLDFDSAQNCWTVSTVPLSYDNYETTYKLQPTDLKCMKFVHTAGFIGKFEESDGSITCKVDDRLLVIPVQ